MGTAGRVAGIVTLAVAVWGCDSDQPLRVAEQTFELSLAAGGSEAPVYFVYDAFEDNDGDFAADDVNSDGQADFFLWCIATLETASAASVPIGYTVEVTILRDGEATREMVTSNAALADSTSNLSDYDPSPARFGGVPTRQPITIDDGGTPRTFRFTNERRLGTASRAVVMSTATRDSAWGMGVGNPLHSFDSMYGLGNGLCSANDPGPAVIDRDSASTYPLQITLNKGDTVTVKARRALSLPTGITVLNPPAPSISASFRVNNKPVSVRGSTASMQGPGEGFTFTFTSR